MHIPDERIRDYVEELSRPSPVVNSSSITLWRLYRTHGVQVIDKLLAEHWAALRASN